MTRNQLPDGVGKKIVEALKRQAEADITPVQENNNNISNELPLTEINDIEELQFQESSNGADSLDSLIIEEEPDLNVLDDLTDNNISITPDAAVEVKAEAKPVEPLKADEFDELINELPVSSEVKHEEKPVINNTPVKEVASQSIPISAFVQSPINNQPQISVEKEQIQRAAIINGQISIPSNVAKLKSLISTLPVGVTKQTGAQIIRQTMEAMGIPMNGVLKEAQEVQEELNSSTRECLLKIQEYKTNIMQLEQSVQEYQKSVNQINDLVSLFLLTDK